MRGWRWIFTGAVVLGATFLPIVAFLTKVYVDSVRPLPPVLKDTKVYPRDAHGSTKIEFQYQAARVPGCIRISSHQLSHPPISPGDGDRRFLFLGGSIAGTGFSSLATQDFTITFHLPSSVTPDTYNYAFRTFYQCGIWNLIPFMQEVNATVVIPP